MNAAKNTQTVTRIAPSPTGLLHVGTARSALFNYLYAHHHGGIFKLRIEDTDRARSTKAFEDDIIRGLTWLGIDYEDFLRQSERADIYRPYLERLIAENKAYVSKEQSKDDPSEEVSIVRLRNKGTTVTFNDLVRGEIKFDTTELGDFVIARSVDEPLYHFVVVVDDEMTGVTHVIRGEDHISNTPRQILLQEALGFERPLYAHLPLILAPDRTKLSKRHGAVSVNQFRDEGYLPEAMLNYLALLGWNPGTPQEIFTLQELVEQFDISRVQKGGAIFDVKKLQAINQEHIRLIATDEFKALVITALPDRITSLSGYNESILEKILPLIQERITTLVDISDLSEAGEFDYYFIRPVLSPEQLLPKNTDSVGSTKEHLQFILDKLGALPSDQFSSDRVKEAIWDYADKIGRGAVLWPMRMALSGREKSSDPFFIASVVGKEETEARLDKAIQCLS